MEPTSEQPYKSEDQPQADNEYARLADETTEAKPEHTGIIRSARNLEMYKRVFGEDFGKEEELILDLGAGDATMADEMEALTDHKAKVISLDRDYGNTPPAGDTPAAAGDATRMPFADGSFDRVVSHSMMYYLGREKGAEAIGEIIRVLKDEGQAVLYPAVPFRKVDTEVGHTEKNSQGGLIEPNLIINKPEGFDTWDEARKQEVYEETVKAVTLGMAGTKLIHSGIAKAIERAGTHRTIERSDTSNLRAHKKN